MRVPFLFMLALLTPLLLCAALLLPLYGAIVGAGYLVYQPASGPHPMAHKLLDVSYVFDTYQNLFNFWSANHATLSFVDYTLPILGLPILGGLLALWLAFKISQKLLNFFHLSASIH